jgi:hypothetical protein
MSIPTYAVIDPATGELVGEYPAATDQAIDQALGAAAHVVGRGVLEMLGGIEDLLFLLLLVVPFRRIAQAASFGSVSNAPDQVQLRSTMIVLLSRSMATTLLRRARSRRRRTPACAHPSAR